MLGFYANLFGHKTKFPFLLEDIHEVVELPPYLASMGSPYMAIYLCRGRCAYAIHGEKYKDEKGRFEFHFQSFVSCNVACSDTLSSFLIPTTINSPLSLCKNGKTNIG